MKNINVKVLGSGLYDHILINEVFTEREMQLGMMRIADRVFLTAETMDLHLTDNHAAKPSLSPKGIDPGLSESVEKELFTMSDGTIVSWTSNPGGLPEIAKKHWVHHDILFTIENRSLDYTAYISIPSLASLDHPEKGIRFFAPGGIRWINYKTKLEALTDSLDLSLAVAKKIQVVNLPAGGNKIAVYGDKTHKKSILRSIFAAIQRLGLIVTVADLGLSNNELEEIAYDVAPTSIVPFGIFKGGILSSIPTAKAVAETLQEISKAQFGTEIGNLTIGIQGIGEVGWKVMVHFLGGGSRIIVSEINPNTLSKLYREYAPQIESRQLIVLEDPYSIFDQQMDIFIPCAVRGILNSHNLNRMKGRVSIIAGPANNLWDDPEKDVWAYHEAGILVVPYEGIGAGGVVGMAYSITRGIMGKPVFDIDEKIDMIKDYVNLVLRMAKYYQLPPQILSDRILLQRVGKNKTITKEETDQIIERLRVAFQSGNPNVELETVKSITIEGLL